MSGLTWELDGKIVHLVDVRYCAGCPRDRERCVGAYTSRIPGPGETPLGLLITDWRRGEGCALEVGEFLDPVGPDGGK